MIFRLVLKLDISYYRVIIGFFKEDFLKFVFLRDKIFEFP
jgi:hypothetical protein